MAKKGTKEVFDLYFKDFSYDTVRKQRPQVDRAEVYAYEKELGKQIFDMDVDELFGLILSFNKNKKVKNDRSFSVSYGSYTQIASTYRSIWNFYIENIEVIKNPWNNPRMRGAAATKRLAESKETFNYNVVEEAILNIKKDYQNSEYGKYLECLILLFYNGFAEAREIVLLKEDNINFTTGNIRLPGRTIQLSNRCLELLQYVHDLNQVAVHHSVYAAEPYQNGYFKFVIRQNEVASFNNKSIEEVGASLTRKISMNIKQKYGIDINYRMVYLLGFYNYIVDKAGKKHADKLITSIRDSDDAQELMKYAREYGVVARNVSYIKRILQPFI